MRFTLLATVTGLLSLLAQCSSPLSQAAFLYRASQPAHITVTPDIRYQTINGWETVAEIGQIDNYAEFMGWRDEAVNLAVNELGLNRIRVEVYAGIENPEDYLTPFVEGRMPRSEWRAHRHEVINDNDDPNLIRWEGFQFAALDRQIEHIVLPMRRLLQARGEELHINVNYVPGSVTPFEHLLVAEEYAEMALAVCLHLRDKYGLKVDSWEMALEPDNGPRTAQEIGKALVAAGRRLKANGFTPRFIAPSTTNMSNAVRYFDEIIRVPGAREFIREVSYHRYSGVSRQALTQIAERAREHKVDTSMLEHMGSGYDDLHEDLKIGNVSAWQQFALAYPGEDNGGYYIVVGTSEATPTVGLSGSARLLRHYFRFVRAGAVRIGAETTEPVLDPLAFVNKNGAYVVILRATAATEFTINGLPGGSYGIRRTTDGEDFASQAPVTLTAGQTLTGSIPAAGLITIYQKSTTEKPARCLLLPILVLPSSALLPTMTCSAA